MENSFLYKFTVFTATFNRGDLLGRVFESLKSQMFKDFEWVIVDDGSNDNTRELVTEWTKENLFPIRYFWQENSGKHVAFNRGVKEARGELFLTIDSDDYCKPDGLDKLNYQWENISEAQKSAFAGVFCNCIDAGGKIIGREFPKDVFDSNMIDIFYKFKAAGDKWGFFRTEVLKQYPFPVIKGEKFFPEAAIWNRISLRYHIRFVNDRLSIVNYQEDGLSRQSVLLRAKNPLGAILYYQEFLSLPVSFYWKFRNLTNYSRFSFHAKKGFIQQIKDLPNPFWKIALVLIIPVSFLFFKADSRKVKPQ